MSRAGWNARTTGTGCRTGLASTGTERTDSPDRYSCSYPRSICDSSGYSPPNALLRLGKQFLYLFVVAVVDRAVRTDGQTKLAVFDNDIICSDLIKPGRSQGDAPHPRLCRTSCGF